MNGIRLIRSDPPLPAYITVPKRSNDNLIPAILVFMHRPGVDNAMQKVVDDLAHAGYVGVCFDVYRNDTLREDYTDNTVFEDFDATLAFVTEEMKDVIDSSRIGVMGFCMGGRYAYLAAARYSQLKAVVSYYGFPTRRSDEQDAPINLVEQMKSPVLGIFGKLDHLYPFEDVEKFRDRLLAQEPETGSHEIEVYDDVGHGFLNPFSPKRYGDGKSATQAWQATLAFYERYV